MVAILALTLLALAQAEQDFPLKTGSRWTYVQDGREAMAIEAMGRERVGSTEAVVARIRGREFFLYSQEDLWLSTGQEGLRVHAHGNPDRRTLKEPPLPLVASRLEKGRAWQSSDRRLTASIQDLEPVRVPAGEFKAWKIDYLLVGDSGSEYSFRAWFAPGTGFVRIELWQQVFKGGKRANAHLYELLRYEPERRITPLPTVTLDAAQAATVERLIDRLTREAVEDREKVVNDLVGMGRGVVPLIRRRMEVAQDRELQGRLEQVLGRFPKVQFVARPLKATGKVGEPLPVDLVLNNISDSKIRILPSLGGSTRYPRFTLEIRDSKGEMQKPSKDAKFICAFENPIEVRDFVSLEPGEEANPFGPGSLEIPMHPWVPQRPGTYTLTAVYDTTGSIPEEWKGSAPQMDSQSQRLAEAMPRGRFESNRLTIVVEP